MNNQKKSACRYQGTASPPVSLLASGYIPSANSKNAATSVATAALEMDFVDFPLSVTPYGIIRYFSTRSSSRAATPVEPFRIISSISSISRGTCEIHSTPCGVTM